MGNCALRVRGSRRQGLGFTLPTIQTLSHIASSASGSNLRGTIATFFVDRLARPSYYGKSEADKAIKDALASIGKPSTEALIRAMGDTSLYAGMRGQLDSAIRRRGPLRDSLMRRGPRPKPALLY
jgi:hypothetical protein